VTVRIAVLTTGRQDWGILRSTCKLLGSDSRFDLRVFAGGMHLSAAFGEGLVSLAEDGIEVCEKLRWIDDAGTTPTAQQAGEAIVQISAALERQRPDALLLVGDRFETLSAATAATLAKVPVIHLHGGEETEGAIDNSIRHAITKLAHLHLVSHPLHAERVLAMGEASNAIKMVGAPGLDNAHRTDLPSRSSLERDLGIALDAPVVLVTLHPTTLGAEPALELAALTEAMDSVDATYVITLPNADPGNELLRKGLVEAAGHGRRLVASALGERRYWGLMRIADAMVGNSSSALIEAPVLRVPAVNIGVRQKGRLRSDNLLDVQPSAPEIAGALKRALSPEFRASLASLGPYGDGQSAPRILAALAAWKIPVPPIKPSIAVHL